jgi:hypothetical protein
MNSENCIVRRRRASDSNGDLTFANTGKYGLALTQSTALAAVVATGTSFLGFLARDVVADPHTLTEYAFPTNPLELPYKQGDKVAIMTDVEEIEVEGADFINIGSGAGQIDGTTAVGTKLTFGSGKFKTVENGEIAFFELAAKLDALNGGTVRFLARRI